MLNNAGVYFKSPFDRSRSITSSSHNSGQLSRFHAEYSWTFIVLSEMWCDGSEATRLDACGHLWRQLFAGYPLLLATFGRLGTDDSFVASFLWNWNFPLWYRFFGKLISLYLSENTISTLSYSLGKIRWLWFPSLLPLYIHRHISPLSSFAFDALTYCLRFY